MSQKMNEIIVKNNQSQYKIKIGNNLFYRSFEEEIGGYFFNSKESKKIVFITDENVYHFYQAKFPKDSVIILSPGEKTKSIETYNSVIGKLIEMNITRQDILVAVGGGVIGDLTGFVASTYLRGIDFIQVPTSLLAMVDSSVGGKVAINHGKGKNLIGQFYNPKGVLIDTTFLETLPEKNFNEGMAEVIKYSMIQSEDMFNLLYKKSREAINENIDIVIKTCVNIKADIVERDFMDTGERMLLNYGHTFGHGVESFFGYKKYSHGEAVAIGMYENVKACLHLGHFDEKDFEKFEVILKKYDLVFNISKEDKTKILEYMINDKKAFGMTYKDIVVRKIGYGKIEDFDFEALKDFYRNGEN